MRTALLDKHRISRSLIVVAALCVANLSATFGQAPRTISHQGFLTDLGGSPVADDTRPMTFSIYDLASGGTALWSETKSVATSGGIYNTELGSLNPINGVLFNQDLWLGVKVGADPEMVDRTKLTSVPSAFGLVMPFEDTLSVVTSDLGIGASSTFAEDIVVQATDAQLGLHSNPFGTFGSGLQLSEIDAGSLVDKWSIIRQTNPNGSRLVFAYGQNADYTSNAPLFTIDSTGTVRGANAYFVAPPDTTVALTVESGGVGARIAGGEGGGLIFPDVLLGTNGAIAAEAGDVAIDLTVAGSSTAFRVLGDPGIFPFPSTRIEVPYSGTIQMVSTDVNGSLDVSGTLTKGSGTFKIDHPLDPENRYLQHSFVESPDMMNVYSGNVVTDDSGYAAIHLPAYFEALNRDFRYQLTPIGTMTGVMVRSEISSNRFEIQAERPNVKVSWQVTGVRKDAYAQMYPVVPETEKAPEHVGTYLHPEAFGLPASRREGQKAVH